MAKADAVEADVSKRCGSEPSSVEELVIQQRSGAMWRAVEELWRSSLDPNLCGPTRSVHAVHAESDAEWSQKRQLTAEPGVDQRADDDAHLDPLWVVERVMLRSGRKVDPDDALAVEVAIAASFGEGGGRECRLRVHGCRSLVVLHDGAVRRHKDVLDVCLSRYCGHCRASV